MNATLQALLHTPPVRSKLTSVQPSSDNFCPVSALASLLPPTPVSGGRRLSVAPTAFYEQLWPEGSEPGTGALGNAQLRKGTQACPAEFLGKLLECAEASAHGKDLFALFRGSERSTVTCSGCGTPPSPTDVCFVVLPVELPKPNGTIEDALVEHQRPEEMVGDNQYSCDTCGGKCDAVKQLSLALPHVLVLHVKLFAGVSKSPQRVRFEQTLSEGGEIFDLCAVVVHVGQDIQGGHYYAYVRSGQKWLERDDRDVRRVGWATVASAQAYVLFYQKRADPMDVGESADLAPHVSSDAPEGGTTSPQVGSAAGKSTPKQSLYAF